MKEKIIGAIFAIFALGIVVQCQAVSTARCTGCHGVNFEKKALNVSKVVKDMNSTEITKDLIGYKNGTFGGSMKGLMKGQVAKYSDEELAEFGKLISK